MRKYIAAILAFCLVLGLSGCDTKQTEVYVQSVSALAQLGGIAPVDWFSGIVVSESVTEIQRDEEKTIEELFVREGDDVVEGQKLFAYDTEQLQLTLDKQRLQLEQLEASIVNFGEEITKLEAAREKANSRDKLEYTIQIQSNMIDLKEAELNLRTKQAEVQKSEHLLENALVVSPVTGRVTAINESGTDEYGKKQAYITIQKTGSYRVKGTLNELQRGAIREEERMRLESRQNPSQFWMGTVSLIDYENPSQGSNNYYGMSPDEMGNSSRYPFYVELESSEGMLLGQHLYLKVASEDGEAVEGVLLGSSFICYEDDGSTYVWAENRGKLEKRSVTLGEYNDMQDVYQIISGLEDTDFVAFPDPELCKEGAPTTRVQQEGGVD